jgi:hypothetical protein
MQIGQVIYHDGNVQWKACFEDTRYSTDGTNDRWTEDTVIQVQVSVPAGFGFY